MELLTNFILPIDGSVNAIAEDAENNVLYVGGTFNNFGTPVSYGAPLDTLDGTRNENLPQANCTITACVSDGNGGWYLGGCFTTIGGEPRNYLAQIDSDGNLTPWAPVVDANVLTLFYTGNRVYAGGNFTVVQGEPKKGIAAFDPQSGVLLDWTTEVNSFNTTVSVSAIYEVNEKVFFGGSFGKTQAFSKNAGIVNIESSGLNVANLNPNGNINKVIADGGDGWYVGGDFSNISGQSIPNLAHISSNGTASGLSLTFGPATNTSVVGLAMDNDKLYGITKGVTQLNGQPNKGIFGINLTDNSLMPVEASFSSSTMNTITTNGSDEILVGCDFVVENPTTNLVITQFGNETEALGGLTANGRVYAALPDGMGGWFVGGTFTTINGVSRNRVAHLNASGEVTDWNPSSGNFVYAMALDGDNLYLVGNFLSMGGISRRNIAAVSASTGALLPFNPGLSGNAFALKIYDNRLYIGGNFASTGGTFGVGPSIECRNYLVIDLNTGAPVGSANIKFSNTHVQAYVNSIEVDDNFVYLGGKFDNVSNSNRNNLALLNRSNGSLTPNIFDTNAEVSALLSHAGKLHVGGNFTTVNGISNSYYTRIDLATMEVNNSLLNISPSSLGTPIVNVISEYNNHLYLGGKFNVVQNQNRVDFAVVDLSDYSVSSEVIYNGMAPTVFSSINCLAFYNGQMLAGGFFAERGSNAKQGIASFNTEFNLNEWNPQINGPVYSILVDNGLIYAGGQFSSVGGQARSNFAVFDLDTRELTSFQMDTDSSIHTLHIKDNSLYIGGSFNNVNGIARSRIAAIDINTQVLISWAPSIQNGIVLSITSSDNELFVGGTFLNVNDDVARRFATLDLTTGQLIQKPFFVSGVSGSDIEVINSLVTSGGKLLVGGEFGFFGGARIRDFYAADFLTGESLGIMPNFLTSGSTNPQIPKQRIAGFVHHGDNLFIAGNFSKVDYRTLRGLAAINMNTLDVLPIEPAVQTSGGLFAIAIEGNELYLGGSFTSIFGIERSNLASINVNTLEVQSWNPGVNGAVYDIKIAGDDLYVAGSFTYISSVLKRRVGKLHRTTGALSAWNPSATSTVYSLALSGTKIYAAGAFANISGSFQRNYLCAYNLATSELLDWSPNISDEVMDIQIFEDKVFISGKFQSVENQDRNMIAAFSRTTKEILPWTAQYVAQPGAFIKRLLFDGNELYACGQFLTTGSGIVRQNIAKINPVSGATLAWPVSAFTFGGNNPYVASMKIDGGNLFFSGRFTSVNGSARRHLAQINKQTGALSSWTINNPFSVFSIEEIIDIEILGTQVYAAGRLYCPDDGELTCTAISFASFNKNTGTKGPWKPLGIVPFDIEFWSFLPSNINVNGLALAMIDDFMYVGGRGVLRRTNPANGDVDSWNPSESWSLGSLACVFCGFNYQIFGSATVIKKFGDRIYVGGDFTDIDGEDVARLAVFTTSCEVNAGTITTNDVNELICIGDGNDNTISLQVSGAQGNAQYFGLVSIPSLEIISLNTNGVFNMDNFPAGKYVVGHISANSSSMVLGASNINELTNCFDLSNFFVVKSTELNGGTISPINGMSTCISGSAPAILNFSVSDNVGAVGKWVVLNDLGNQIITTNNSGSFNFTPYGPGAYQVAYASFPNNSFLASISDPLQLPACVAVSNILNIEVSECEGLLISTHPNPTAGISNVIFSNPAAVQTTLEVLDIQGRTISTLFNQVSTNEFYQEIFDGSNLPNGVYFYRLTTPDKVVVEKFMIAH